MKYISKIACGLIFFTASCGSKKTIRGNIEMIILLEQSYSYDLKNGIYTVNGVEKYDSIRKTYFISSTPLKVKFNLNEEEKNKIKNKYYDLEIDKMPDKKRIEDSCFMKGFPAFYYTLYAKTDKKEQVLDIDLDCNAFIYPYNKSGLRLKEFILFCLGIVKGKSEIKNVPKSGAIYM